MLTISSREKRLLKILSLVLSAVLIYYFAIEPMMNIDEGSNVTSDVSIKKIKDLNNIYEEYSIAKQKKDRYENLLKNKNENLGSLLDTWAKEYNIKDNISSINRTPRSIKNKFDAIHFNIKFVALPIQSLVNFLYKVETSGKLIKIKYIKIKKVKGSRAYDATIELETYVRK